MCKLIMYYFNKWYVVYYLMKYIIINRLCKWLFFTEIIYTTICYNITFVIYKI